MTLYVNGQDINRITFSILETAESHTKTTEVGPEGYLHALQEYLSSNKVTAADISKVVAVVGPGSATALRASLSILNTIGFTRDVELIGVEKTMEENDTDLIKRLNDNDFTPVSRDNMLIPTYVSSPRITASKKDHLRR